MVSELVAGSNDKDWLKTMKDSLESATWEVAEDVVEKYAPKVGEEKAKEAVKKIANWCLEVMNNALEVVWDELLEN